MPTVTDTCGLLGRGDTQRIDAAALVLWFPRLLELVKAGRKEVCMFNSDRQQTSDQSAKARKPALHARMSDASAQQQAIARQA